MIPNVLTYYSVGFSAMWAMPLLLGLYAVFCRRIVPLFRRQLAKRLFSKDQSSKREKRPRMERYYESQDVAALVTAVAAKVGWSDPAIRVAGCVLESSRQNHEL
ncbi:hypothetical protein B0H66DRAFT_399291 [Apodospora peruviana]|uniref:Uncharacterized protein n=1 Tax=Apodospora peruviana TaxID=516989 RepID=A0AAE0HTB0_9PEZI|nr:hypothetical protein B0H66DRAFT_399291 [Apodospora peruviana]